jgi:hypothetical protein
MSIVQSGSINTTAQIVPDLTVQIVPPSITLLNGVPSNILGLVGTATWGPVNAATPFSTMADYSSAFGAIQARKCDMGTAVAAAVLQGANNFRGVRVTDGTDVAASAVLGLTGSGSVVSGGSSYTTSSVVTLSNGAVINVTAVSSGAITTFTIATQPTSAVTGVGAVTQVSATGGGTGATLTFTYSNGATATSKYTGSGANGDTVTLAAGSAASTHKATIARPGFSPEVFDNIAGTGATFWTNLTSAINNGVSGIRGPSNYLVLTAGGAATAPANGAYTLSGGTDGATTITGSVLLGADTGNRTGLYALRGTATSIAALVDDDDSTNWSAQVAYGLSEGTYMILVGPNTDYANVTTAASNKATAGIDSYAAKVLLGDWVYFNDTVNGQVRLISPQGFIAGRLANLSPQNSGLNKPIYGVVGTQKSYANQIYSAADLTILATAGIDVITNPVPGGSYFGARFGRNSSSSAVIHGDNYTRMTNYIAATLNSGMGQVIGKLQSATQQREAAATLSAFFAGLWQQGMIGNSAGTQPFSVQIDSRNNPQNRVALGYEQADVKVQYLSVIEYFIANVEGGQSVQISRQQTQIAA